MNKITSEKALQKRIKVIQARMRKSKKPWDQRIVDFINKKA